MDSEVYGTRSNVSALRDDQAMQGKTSNEVSRPNNANGVGPEGFAGKNEIDLGRSSEAASKDCNLEKRLSSAPEGLLDILNSTEYRLFSAEGLKEIESMVSSLEEFRAGSKDIDRNIKMQEEINEFEKNGIDSASESFLEGDKSKNEGLSCLPPLNVPDRAPSPDYVPNCPSSPKYVPNCPSSPEYARNCPSSPDYVPSCPSSPKYVHNCPSSPEYVRNCPSSSEYVPNCPSSPDYVPNCPSSPDYVPDCPLSPEYVPNCPSSPEYVPNCPSSPEYVPNCPSSPEYVPNCPSSPEYFPNCPSSPEYVRNCPPSPEYVPNCPSSPEYVPSCPPLPEYVPKTPPSPVLNSSPIYALPVEKEFGIEYWQLKPVLPIHPYEIDAYKAVFDYQKKFGPSSSRHMKLDKSKDYVPESIPSPDYFSNSLSTPTYASPFEKEFGRGYSQLKPERQKIRPPSTRSSEDGDNNNGEVPCSPKKHENHESSCTKRKAVDDWDSAQNVKRPITGGWLEEWVMTGNGGWLED